MSKPTLLEYYAGQALTGILVWPDAYNNPDKAASFAFGFAEAMIKEAEKKERK